MEETSPENSAFDSSVGTSALGGELRVHEFSSRVFRNTRMLRVWIPPGYEMAENSARRYPVFYLNDGQNLFESATAFAGVDWRVGETAEAMIRAGVIPPMIFVGIDNAQTDRIKEYVPYRSMNPGLLRPRGKRYPEFLLKEVMPFVEQHYRIAGGAEQTSLGGSSLGGLISLYTVIAAPGVFGRVLLESPSLWVANRRILGESRGFRRWPQKVFVGVGTREVGREDKDRQTVKDVRELEKILRNGGLGEQRLKVEVAEGATHSEGAWAARFPDALGFFFGK